MSSSKNKYEILSEQFAESCTLLFKESVHMAPFGIEQPTEWVRAKTPGILFTLYTTEKWQGLFQSLQKAQWILNPWAACCQAGCGTSQQHWCLCGAFTESPLTQQPALPRVPVLPEPCLECSCHQSAVKILQRHPAALCLKGTSPGAQGSNSKTILKAWHQSSLCA